jgi:hypothetical protein
MVTVAASLPPVLLAVMV